MPTNLPVRTATRFNPVGVASWERVRERLAPLSPTLPKTKPNWVTSMRSRRISSVVFGFVAIV